MARHDPGHRGTGCGGRDRERRVPVAALCGVVVVGLVVWGLGGLFVSVWRLYGRGVVLSLWRFMVGGLGLSTL